MDEISTPIEAEMIEKENISIEDFAKEIIEGKHGRGVELRKNVEKNGFKYSEVMLIVRNLKEQQKSLENKTFDQELAGPYVTNTTVNLRNEPNVKSSIRSILFKGTKVNATGDFLDSPSGKWLKVNTNKMFGYCLIQYLDKV